MTDRHAELDAALERTITAARDHLAAVRAADGTTDDEDVWRAYVELNNASFEYDELLLDAYREVTPWDVQRIDPNEVEKRAGGSDEYEHVISVRQRRDYRVPSVAALLSAAESARRTSQQGAEDEPVAAVETVGEAILELMQASDVSLGALEIPELEALDGVVVVAEVGQPLDPEAYDETDGTGPFGLETGDRLVDRLDEHAGFDYEDDEEEDDDEEDEEDEEDDEDGEDADEEEPASKATH
jgi:hypothetical protein